MADIVQEILVRPIQLADQLTKAADEANSYKVECSELKSKTEKLAGLLRQAARASNDLYERPTRRILLDTEQALERALALVLRSRTNGLVKRVFTINSSAAFRKSAVQLENSIGDVTWLLRVSSPSEINDFYGLPPIAANEPILCLIWEHIANLSTGTADDRSDAAAALVSLARDNDRYVKLIIEEGGVGPLLKLLKEGKIEGQENAARAIGLLGRDDESVEHLIHAGVCSAFAKILKEGTMKVQSVVAWAVSELAGNYALAIYDKSGNSGNAAKCQDLFAQNNVIRLLVGHLAFETVQEHSKYAIVSKATSISQFVLASSNNNTTNANNNRLVDHDDEKNGRNLHQPGNVNGNGNDNRQSYKMHNVVATTMAMKDQLNNGAAANQENIPNNGKLNSHHQHQPSVASLSGIHNKGRELEDPETKTEMKAMAARALWQLAKNNSPICRSITESRALLCFAVLLEKGPPEVKFNSAMALMEITSVAEQDSELRRAAFKPNSPACKAVVDQLLIIIEKADSNLLLPCIKSVGNLARTFRATETRMISPLVKFLDNETDARITMEACIALTKFACRENYLHQDHCKAILSAGGAAHLVQLVYTGEETVPKFALTLLSYIALHVADSEDLAKADVLPVLEWASKHPTLAQEEKLKVLVIEAKERLELYQLKGSRGAKY